MKTAVHTPVGFQHVAQGIALMLTGSSSVGWDVAQGRVSLSKAPLQHLFHCPPWLGKPMLVSTPWWTAQYTG